MFHEENRMSEDNIISALKGGRVVAEIQAIYSLRETDKILYGKLLPLLLSEDHTQIIPSEDFESFVQLVGKAPLLDMQLLQIALRELRADGFAVLGCNISSDSLSEPMAWQAIAHLLNENAACANRLVLEIVETCPLGNIVTLKTRIEELKKCGVRVAIDSFGAGFISPLDLMELKVDIIKFDEEIIRKAIRMAPGLNPVEHLVSFARSSAPTIVMNGIDTEDSKKFAIHSGATHGTGTFFSSNVLLSKQGEGEERENEVVLH